ncbi:hypothetical protein VVD49_02740 [Uliginosibacterium sp. H3]|uniref:PKD domain-containing protein n=1 Tax=Uliginosibacterium silvisoli TaxID=3114758 RepID=A0ABU6K082_9RHOO|nr:hypothetical protein [Uliginosibacterium sp. H3]
MYTNHFTTVPKRAALAMIAAATLLSACGGGGDAGPEALPDSITITSLDGPSGVTGGTETTLNVKVATTGGIGAGEITYTWEQTEGTAVLSKTQSNGNYESTLTIRPAPVLTTGSSVTFKVTTTARGKTSSQSKTIPVNP